MEGTLVFTPDGSVDAALREPEAVWKPARFFPKDYSVDNRRLTHALEKSCRDRGVEFRSVAVRAVEQSQVMLADGQAVPGDVIVNAAGCWASQIHAPGVTFEVRPVKGQMAAVMAEGWELRHIVRSEHVYMVPRFDGRILVGATMEEAGYDKSVWPETIEELLKQSAQLVPKIRNAPVVETWAGLRPATRSGLPLIGPTPLPGYYLATGHFRNGILLAPLTAQLLAEVIRTGKTPSLLRPFASV
jgi:glycine oxidase